MSKYIEQLSIVRNLIRLNRQLKKEMDVDPCLWKVGSEQECEDNAKSILNNIHKIRKDIDNIWLHASKEAKTYIITAIVRYNMNIAKSIANNVSVEIDKQRHDYILSINKRRYR